MNKSILLLFGEDDLLALLKDVLSKEGYEVSLSTTPKVHNSRPKNFDLVICDISAVSSDQEQELTREVKNLSRNVPMLLIGDITDKPDWLKRAGLPLSKPVKMSDLKTLVKQMLKTKRQPQLSLQA